MIDVEWNPLPVAGAIIDGYHSLKALSDLDLLGGFKFTDRKSP